MALCIWDPKRRVTHIQATNLKSLIGGGLEVGGGLGLGLGVGV